MKSSVLYALWGGLFALCAGLGFVQEPAGVVKGLLTGLSLAFFLPPALLIRAGHRRTLLLVRNLALGSLVLTAALVILNFYSVYLPESAGNFLYCLLVIVSSPMVCSQYWILSLFLWACLLVASQSAVKKR